MIWVLVITLMAGTANRTEIHYRLPSVYSHADCEKEAKYHSQKPGVQARCYAEAPAEVQ